MPTPSTTLHQIASGSAPSAVATVTASAPPASTAPQTAWWQQELAAVPAELQRIGRERVVKRRWRKSVLALAREALARSAAARATAIAAGHRPAVAEPMPQPRRRRMSREEREDQRACDRLLDGLRRGIGIPRPDAAIRSILAEVRPTQADDSRPTVTCYEAFAGGGLLGLGVEAAIIEAGGYPVPLGYCEMNDRAALAYEINHEPDIMRQRDICEIADGGLGHPLTVRERGLIDLLACVSGRPAEDTLDVLVGGPPCQAFSTASLKKKKPEVTTVPKKIDPRILLYQRMVRLIEVVRPKLALIENVGEAEAHPIVADAVRHLASIGYRVSAEVVDAADLGTPQIRERYLVVAARADVSVEAFDFSAMRRAYGTRHHGVEEVLHYGDEDPARPWTIGAKHGKIGVQARWAARHPGRLLPALLAPPRQTKLGKAWGSTYQRMDPTLPAATITRYFGSPANGCYLHPFEERGLSIEDGLRIQGVPRWYAMPADISEGAARLIVANGAPPQFGSAVIGQAFRQGILRV